MATIKVLEPYSDESGNVIEYEGTPITTGVAIQFDGSGNALRVGPNSKIVELSITFAGDGGTVEIGDTTTRRTGLRFGMRIGFRSRITLGRDVGSQTRALLIASEGAEVKIGDDAMIASDVEIRTDDSHAIYDVKSGRRINPAQSVEIGDHVWIGKYVAILGGASVGSGSVIGFRSIVTKKFPNNCIIVGSPARVIRKDIAWERPSLKYREPGIDGVPPGMKRTEKHWQLTQDDVIIEPAKPQKPPPVAKAKSMVKRILPESLHDPARALVTRLRNLTPQ